MQAVYYVANGLTVSTNQQFTLRSFHDEYSLWFDVGHRGRYYTVRLRCQMATRKLSKCLSSSQSAEHVQPIKQWLGLRWQSIIATQQRLCAGFALPSQISTKYYWSTSTGDVLHIVSVGGHLGQLPSDVQSASYLTTFV